MTPSPRAILAFAIGGVLLAGCAQPARRTGASVAAVAACRSDVDRVYAAQNRADLSIRDQRDTPFAGSYLSGVTSRGLGAEYGRENMISSCLANSGTPSPAASPGQTGSGTPSSPGSPFSPTAR